ncbi:MAG: Peptidoglycan glycosyltransferase [Candidatus Kaiserbacteria bacterium GW2011_GWC2_52_8b]|uniref:Peptidoglycan glycosyltransferase n=2 Tax=Candidatus Kaiseribacteriota TaxID=1752734 RepID=A0A0G2AES0_9BACT|nr:MAG: Peptidoglycan glycosyltransferase [Candidatus Kaiserbacteria bacterium GW2011_GWA2_52_12]KKW30994.1 MAG: Peptidoglycan glycosyltransferase [Candidatus Kaiserbacteria bacterium GW2011_GWC2_52_8b]
MTGSNVVLRTRILCGLFILAAVLIIARLYFVQIVKGSEFLKSASAQYQEPSQDTQGRGTIFFTTKDGELVAGAVMQSGWRIAIQPKDIVDSTAAYAAMNAIVPIDIQRFTNAAAKKNDPYEEVAFHVADEAVSALRTLKIAGVMYVPDQWRLYPARTLAAQTIGFVGYQGNTKTGVYGLERSYQDTLTIESSDLYVNPFAEIFSNVEAFFSRNPATYTGSIVTSIEPKVQQQLEDTLDGVMEMYTPAVAGGIVMDPHTGEIYAIAVRPSFDLNTYNMVDEVSTYSNPLVEGSYEMGSIMKPLTMAEGIDAGAVTPNTTYNDTGCKDVSGKTICNYDRKARGVVNMQEVLNQSLNLGASFVVNAMGHRTFADYVQRLQLGKKTGIDLPNEAVGQIWSLQSGSDIDFASASFGQSIAVTSIEMIRALSILANGGALPSPHIVTSIKYQSGLSRSMAVPEGIPIVTGETATTVTNMLVEVFDDALLKGILKQEHYSIAAKTGTAQIAIPGGGGYYTDRFLHSFFGYFPAHDPKFIIFLFAKEPHGAEFASATLAHPFMDITKFLINYYDIPPDR